MKTTLLIQVDNVAKGFLEAAAECLTGEITLCFEHAFPTPDALALYGRHQSNRSYEPMRDTIEPHTDLFYCSLTLDFARELSLLADIHDASELFWHVKGYNDQCMRFWVHDAYGRSAVWLSGSIPESQLEGLAARCGEELESADASVDWDRPCRINRGEQVRCGNGGQGC
jgi:hypothetical protein